MINKFIRLFKELFFKFPKYFILLIFIILFQAFFNALTVISIAPIVDILMNNSFDSQSGITKYFINLFIF